MIKGILPINKKLPIKNMINMLQGNITNKKHENMIKRKASWR